VPNLQDLLADLTSGDESRAEAAVPALLSMDAEAVPALLELTRSPEADSRWWALCVLASSPQCQSRWLVPFLNDPAPEVRQCAALGLAIRPDESAAQPLIEALNDDDSMVGNLAANALATTAPSPS
jgi:HEAT repeat protein